jgi:hypothetical protein
MPGIMFATSNAAWTIWANKFSELRSSTLHPAGMRATSRIGHKTRRRLQPSSSRTWTASSSPAITAKTSAETYAARTQDLASSGPLQDLSPEGERLMPRLAAVLGGPLCSDFVIPEGLEPPLTLARIFIVAAQNVQIWLSGTSSGFCPRSDQIGRDDQRSSDTCLASVVLRWHGRSVGSWDPA